MPPHPQFCRGVVGPQTAWGVASADTARDTTNPATAGSSRRTTSRTTTRTTSGTTAGATSRTSRDSTPRTACYSGRDTGRYSGAHTRSDASERTTQDTSAGISWRTSQPTSQDTGAASPRVRSDQFAVPSGGRRSADRNQCNLGLMRNSIHVTLNEVKGLLTLVESSSRRFFAALRMTRGGSFNSPNLRMVRFGFGTRVA